MKSCGNNHIKKTSSERGLSSPQNYFFDFDLSNTRDAAPQPAADKAAMEAKAISEEPVFGEITPQSLTTTVPPPPPPPHFVVATGLSTAANAGTAENIIIAAANAAANTFFIARNLLFLIIIFIRCYYNIFETICKEEIYESSHKISHLSSCLSAGCKNNQQFFVFACMFFDEKL